MKGNINWQVQKLYHESGIKQIGQSKHEVKESIRKSINGQSRAATWHAMGKGLGIYSIRTADAYRDVWRQLGTYVKETFQVKDLEKLTGEHVEAFLKTKIQKNIAHSTLSNYAAALEKLESALNGYAKVHGTGNTYAFAENIVSARSMAKESLEKFTGSRAYERPEEIVKSLRSQDHRLVARIQLESGARVNECNHLTQEALRGLTKDPVTGETKGVLYVEKGKGGKSGEKYLSQETYQELKEKIRTTAEGRFCFEYRNYIRDLKKATDRTHQKYHASHGLRWNFAQRRFRESQEHGSCYTQALLHVSQELFHERGDITEHYLK
ncbi:MAG: hypothetical protein KKD44_17205 [Proteobacteria bacterium]|nr:hypothetical protein [Pseudomonadota bacterium]